MKITRDDVAWLARDYALLGIWCLTFVRGLDEAEAFRRVGVEEGSIRSLTHEELMNAWPFPPTPNKILAGHLDGWTVLVEVFGRKSLDALQALSVGTEAVSVQRHDDAAGCFAYAVDGEHVTAFDPIDPTERSGSDPDRLVDLMRDVGFDPAYELSIEDDEENEEGRFDRPAVDGALMLAARLTGVVLTPDVLNGPLLGADVTVHRSQS
ncbi:DUF6461 domain-containing protein [Streptosporangium sp. H16]|uniref:DUF6461 domain-containing protein n=1 Tax=Streptosporangium sp. H16 TaxID=3444184 RepID=UPI003F7A1575